MGPAAVGFALVVAALACRQVNPAFRPRLGAGSPDATGELAPADAGTGSGSGTQPGRDAQAAGGGADGAAPSPDRPSTPAVDMGDIVATRVEARGPDVSTPRDTLAGADAASTDTACSGGALVGLHARTVQLAGTTLDVTIPAVNPARAALFFSASTDAIRPVDGNVRGELVSASTVRFSRSANGAQVTLALQVVEWNQKVSVQRGNVSFNFSGPLDVAIAPVDLGRSFALVSADTQSSYVYDADDYARIRLVAPNRIQVGPIGAVATASWQVITMDGAAVQHGDVSFGASQASALVPVAGAAPSNSFAVVSWNAPNTSGAGHIGPAALRARLRAAGELVVERAAVGRPLEASYFVVSLLDGSRVQQVDSSFDPTQLSQRAVIARVDRNRTLPLVSGNQRFGITPYAVSPSSMRFPVGVSWFTAALPDDTSLNLTRGLTMDAPASATSFLVEFAAACP